ncbi:MAG: glycosyltransferase family 2 protein [Bacteroidales bacterium]|nr:glycosyltransferase family 2 protein [Bacteroidales bacterium]
MLSYVIVVTYNATRWIEKCFGSLQQSTIPVNIIAIDNGSTDGTPEIIRNKFPLVQVIQNSDNLGFGKANNVGIRKAYDAGADYVFLLNQDAWVEPDTIEKLIQAQQREPEFGIVSPVHLNGSGDALDQYFSQYIIPKFCPKLYSDKWLGKLKDEIYEVEFVNAAAWLLYRKTIETVGGFSPLFFLYAEDDNYLHRLRNHGLKVGVYPHVSIFHDRHEREPNQYFTNSEEFKIRQLILKYSDPGQEVDIYSYLSVQRKRIIKGLLRLRFDDTRITMTRYQRLKKLASEINAIKKATTNPGMHFL